MAEKSKVLMQIPQMAFFLFKENKIEKGDRFLRDEKQDANSKGPVETQKARQ